MYIQDGVAARPLLSCPVPCVYIFLFVYNFYNFFNLNSHCQYNSQRQYRAKIESYYTGSDARLMWQGLQTITDYKGKHSLELPSDTSLLDELNHFYARFEACSTETCTSASAVPDNCVITLSIANVSKTFKQVNIHKAAGPDGLPGCVLRECAEQLAGVFTDIFNMSLIESVIPTCFKQTTIVSVPKNTKATCLND